MATEHPLTRVAPADIFGARSITRGAPQISTADIELDGMVTDRRRSGARDDAAAPVLMARLVDVAAAAGVSVGLVSRVLNDHPATRATVETRQRILRVSADLGYRPNYAARALKLARANTLALVVPEITSNAMATELIRGVEDASGEEGLAVLLAGSESITDQRHVLRLLNTGQVDGLLLQGRDDETTASLTRLVGTAPVVLINARIESRPGSVMIEDRQAACTAATFLLERGHRRIGLINGLPTSLTAKLREEGFREALAAYGVVPREDWISRLGYLVSSAEPAVAGVLGRSDAPSALVVANVNCALGVLSAARHLGLAVPEDLSVIAIHDAWTSSHTWPPLTTVRLPLHELGRQAVLALQNRLAGLVGTDLVVDNPAPVVIERESVRGLP